MNKAGTSVARHLLFAVFVCYLATIGSLGCRFDATGLTSAPEEELYECTVKLLRCKPAPVAVTVTPSGSGTDPHNIKAGYQVDKDFRVLDRLYVNKSKPWVVQTIEEPALRGGIFIRPDFDHAGLTDSRFLEINFPSYDHIADLYVAYDSRANPKPAWLVNSADWSLVKTGPNQPAYILTGMPDQSRSPPGKVRFEIYRRVAKIKGHPGPGGGPMLTLPANNCFQPGPSSSKHCTGQVGWPGVPPQNRAMYFVVVARKIVSKCTYPGNDKMNMFTGCKSTEEDSEKEALDGCKKAREAKTPERMNPDNFQCGDPSCTEVSACTEKTGFFQSRSFPISSVIEFEPSKFKAEAGILVDKKHRYTRKVEGRIYFEYLLDNFDAMTAMQIDGMRLQVGSVATKAGNFTDIVITLREPVRATCQDPTPPWAGDRPCTTYRIPAKRFKALLSAKKDRKTLLVDPVNLGHLDIHIKHVTRTFRIASAKPLVTSVKVDGDSVPLEIGIDLFGHFLNFAPRAVGRKESTGAVACGYSRVKQRPLNRDRIRLDSAGSFEVYGDKIPQKAYQWYEDYTWLGEKLWGTGSTHWIPPGEMSFGTHEMTLLIRDAFGVADTDTFKVAVYDTEPPMIFPPRDVYALVTPPNRLPVELYLGEASAWDGCFGPEVALTHDGPPVGRFGEGMTTVTWTAEDGAGNSASASQKVWVFPPPDRRHPGRLALQLTEITALLVGELHASGEAAGRCDEAALRAMSVPALAETIQALANLARSLPVAPDAQGLHAETLLALERSEQRLGDAARLVERAVQEPAEGERRGLCAAAADALEGASGQMAEVGAMIEALAGAPQPAPPPEAQRRCEHYAEQAVAQAVKGFELNCGFPGPEWSTDPEEHYRACLERPEQAMEELLAERVRLLERCADRR